MIASIAPNTEDTLTKRALKACGQPLDVSIQLARLG
jgi:hypothetical protein